MCLDIDSSIHKRNRSAVAKIPLVVYKVLKNVDATGGYAPYRNTRWTFGKAQSVEKFGIVHCDFGDFIENGLHAFIGQPYRARTLVHSRRGAMICPAIIPAGARFYVGEADDVVANNLIVYAGMESLLAAYGIKKMDPAISRHSVMTKDYHK